jgi:hypothetical protein
MYEHISTRGSCVDPHNTPPVEGFKKFGQGFCLDASNAWYSGFASPALPMTTSDTYCLEWCSQNLHRDLVAVEIYHDNEAASTICYCSFSGGAAPSDISLSDYTPTANRAVTYEGVGSIQSTDATPSAVCYQNIVSIDVVLNFFVFYLLSHPKLFFLPHLHRITTILLSQLRLQQRSQL